MISHVIRYNATDVPFKQATFSQNKYPNSKWRYAQIANYLNLGGNTDDEKVELLIAAVEDLKRQVDIPATIKDVLIEQGTSEEFFMSHLETMAEQAFDDQCTGANPRYPLIVDLKELMVKAYG